MFPSLTEHTILSQTEHHGWCVPGCVYLGVCVPGCVFLGVCTWVCEERVSGGPTWNRILYCSSGRLTTHMLQPMMQHGFQAGLTELN